MQHVIRLKVSWAKQRSSPENDKLNKLFKYLNSLILFKHFISLSYTYYNYPVNYNIKSMSCCDHDHAEEHHKEDQNAH
jgi:hypothetical protein